MTNVFRIKLITKDFNGNQHILKKNIVTNYVVLRLQHITIGDYVHFLS